MELLSKLLEVGKVAARTEVNLADKTAHVSDDVVLLEIPDEGYDIPPSDSEGPAKAGDMSNVHLGEKRKKSSKKSKSQREEGVTLTGLSVSGTSSPRKKQKFVESSTGKQVSTSTLAPAIPLARTTTIR